MDKDDVKLVANGAGKALGAGAGYMIGLKAGSALALAVAPPIAVIPVIGPPLAGLTGIFCIAGGAIAGGFFGWKAPGAAIGHTPKGPY